MKGWLYVISNRAVPRLVKVGTTAKDPHSYAESLDKGGLPFPHEVGYEALVPDMDRAGKAAEEALAAKAEGKGWYSCSIAEAVRTVAEAAGRYLRACVTDPRPDTKTVQQPQAADHRGGDQRVPVPAAQRAHLFAGTTVGIGGHIHRGVLRGHVALRAGRVSMEAVWSPGRTVASTMRRNDGETARVAPGWRWRHPGGAPLTETGRPSR